MPSKQELASAFFYALALAAVFLDKDKPGPAFLAIALCFVLYLAASRALTRVSGKYSPRAELLFPVLLPMAVSAYKGLLPHDCLLRCNVMIVEDRPFQKPFASIRYYAGNYDVSEQKQTYASGVGATGRALALKMPVFYSRAHSVSPDDGMTPTQKAITKNTNSVMSLPVFHPNDTDLAKPIAVLNFDSHDDIEVTGFHDRENQRRMMEWAGVVGVFLSAE